MPPRECQNAAEEYSGPDLDRAFSACAGFIQKLPKNGPIQTPIGEQLKMYAWYKQATIGPCNTEKPAFYHPIERVKWNAWKDLGDMSKEEAKKEYIKFYIEKTSRDYEANKDDIPKWMKEEKYCEVKKHVKDNFNDFGITHLHTSKGDLELRALAQSIGFDL